MSVPYNNVLGFVQEMDEDLFDKYERAIEARRSDELFVKAQRVARRAPMYVKTLATVDPEGAARELMDLSSESNAVSQLAISLVLNEVDGMQENDPLD